MTGPDCDVTVVIPFDDDEDLVGALSARVAAHLRALDLRFEILAVAEDSGDNSVPLLAIVRPTIPELRVLFAGGGRGFSVGAGDARGRVVWLLDVKRAAAPLSPFSWAFARVVDGVADVVDVPGRYLVCRRTRAWRVLERTRGRNGVYEKRALRRAASYGLRIESPPAHAGGSRPRGLARFLEHLAPARFASLLRSRA